MYEWADGELVWRDPSEENLHVEVAVRNAGDGRFVPGVRVLATLTEPGGDEVGTHEQPLLWHRAGHAAGPGRRLALLAAGHEGGSHRRLSPPRVGGRDRCRLRRPGPLTVSLSALDDQLSRSRCKPAVFLSRTESE